MPAGWPLSLYAGWRRACRRACRPPSRVAWIAAYGERGACVHDYKWTDGGYAMVTGVCRAGLRI